MKIKIESCGKCEATEAPTMKELKLEPTPPKTTKPRSVIPRIVMTMKHTSAIGFIVYFGGVGSAINLSKFTFERVERAYLILLICLE